MSYLVLPRTCSATTRTCGQQQQPQNKMTFQRMFFRTYVLHGDEEKGRRNEFNFKTQWTNDAFLSFRNHLTQMPKVPMVLKSTLICTHVRICLQLSTICQGTQYAQTRYVRAPYPPFCRHEILLSFPSLPGTKMEFFRSSISRYYRE